MSPPKPGSDGVPSTNVSAFSARFTPSASSPAVSVCALSIVWNSLPLTVHDRSLIVVALRWSRTCAPSSPASSTTVRLFDLNVPTLTRSSARVPSPRRFLKSVTSRASDERLLPVASLVAYGAGMNPNAWSSVPVVCVCPSVTDRNGCRLIWSPGPSVHWTRELACSELRSSCWICRNDCASDGSPVARSV